MTINTSMPGITSPSGMCTDVKPSDKFVSEIKVLQFKAENAAIAARMINNNQECSFISDASPDLF